MLVNTKLCLWCMNNGRKCDVCHHVPAKVKKNPVKKKERNQWGCTCQKNEYCDKCRTDKITAEGEEKYDEFLELTWMKLKKYNIDTTGSPEVDFDILELCGAWKVCQPQIVLIREAVERGENPV